MLLIMCTNYQTIHTLYREETERKRASEVDFSRITFTLTTCSARYPVLQTSSHMTSSYITLLDMGGGGPAFGRSIHTDNRSCPPTASALYPFTVPAPLILPGF
ncbi:hypothetical protein GDO78_009493 [Eleutherodactylus coqui]|uniref:Uncharacterized protein n=1 Tax=Eleutherodactylus coqui TaxID=57060 RepID=A0A8J6F8R5_ELECQ|nr:hypothetical protein GDO78_009493 [Eleutherodactylus coqui]